MGRSNIYAVIKAKEANGRNSNGATVTAALFILFKHVKPNYCSLASRDTDSGDGKDIKKVLHLLPVEAKNTESKHKLL